VRACRVFLERLVLRGLSRFTAEAYAYDLALVHRWLAAAGLTLEQLTTDHVHQFLAWERGRNSHPKSINRRLHTLRLFYAAIMGTGLPGGLRGWAERG
jgi:site-specific recombinase XerD